MFASQPIAVANNSANDKVQSAGSPMSLTTGSFQNRFYPGGSPGQSLGPIAIPDASSWPRPTPSSFPDHDLCRNYTCCGVALPDLHALVDHFESCHVEVFSPDPVSQFDVRDTPDAPDAAHPVDSPAFDADDMDISEPSPSPPATPSPVLTHPSAFDPIRVLALPASQSVSAATRLFRPSQYSSYSSLAGANGAPAHAASAAAAVPSAFNRYAGYSDYSSDLPGTDPSPTYTYTEADAEALALAACAHPFRDSYPYSDNDAFAYAYASDKPSAAYAYDVSAGVGAGAGGAGGDMGAMRCVPPALLCSQSAEPSPLNTPGSSRAPSPLGGPVYTPGTTLSLNPKTSAGRSTSATSGAQGPFSRLAKSTPSSSSSSPRVGAGHGHAPKPFHCPKPGCNKAYKQQNGLKYHLAHGACNYAPRDPEVERLSDGERERRERPWVCAVGSVGLEPGEAGQAAVCGRRYKNMNGLRYHYTHTGAHGAVGLEMLAQGRHPLPDVPTTNRLGKTIGPNGTVVTGTTSSGTRSPQGHSPTQSLAGSPVASSVDTSPRSQQPSRSSSTSSGAGYFPGQPTRSAPLPPVVSMPVPTTQTQTQAQSMLGAMGSSMMTVPVPRPVAVPVRLRSQQDGGSDVEMQHHGQGHQGKKEQNKKSPAPSPMEPFLGVPWAE